MCIRDSLISERTLVTLLGVFRLVSILGIEQLIGSHITTAVYGNTYTYEEYIAEQKGLQQQ